MTANAPSNSFDIADRRITALRDKLRARGVCGCCTARALLYHGATLMEDMKGSTEAVELCEGVADRLRKNGIPPPPNVSEAAH